jgi:hypothetical protein
MKILGYTLVSQTATMSHSLPPFPKDKGATVKVRIQCDEIHSRSYIFRRKGNRRSDILQSSQHLMGRAKSS